MIVLYLRFTLRNQQKVARTAPRITFSLIQSKMVVAPSYRVMPMITQNRLSDQISLICYV